MTKREDVKEKKKTRKSDKTKRKQQQVREKEEDGWCWEMFALPFQLRSTTLPGPRVLPYTSKVFGRGRCVCENTSFLYLRDPFLLK